MSKILFLARFMGLALVAASFSACFNPFDRIREAERRERENPPPPVKVKTPPPRPQYVQRFNSPSFDLTTVTGEFESQVFTEFNKGNFAWLEQTAANARKNKERLKGGYWTIRTFYAGILPKNNTDDEFRKHFESLNRWKNAYPKSITVRVALAESWQNYAGQARGRGYAETVPVEGWKLFKERMENSKKELLEAKNLADRCPYWYVSMMEIAKNEGWELEDFEALFKEAAAAEPGFYYFHQQMGLYLLPRWNGSREQWEAFMHRIYDENRAQLYYLTLSYFVLNVAGIEFDYRRFDQEKGKKGFDELTKNYGMEKSRLNSFAKFSVLANDFTSAVAAFEEIGEDLDIEVWGAKNMYDGFRMAALEAVKVNGKNVL